MTVADLLAVIGRLSTVQRRTLFEMLTARWCIHCGREREGGAAGCECGRAFDPPMK
jgi:hypothetical protein